MKFLYLLFLFFCLSVLTSCHSYVYDQKIELEGNEWSYAKSIDFSFEIQDTTNMYHLYLEVEHLSDYAYQNVYAELEVIFPDKKTRKELLSMELSDGSGKWIGDCNKTICKRKMIFMPRARFLLQGRYKLNFKQSSRISTLKGIKSIRLFIEKEKK